MRPFRFRSRFLCGLACAALAGASLAGGAAGNPLPTAAAGEEALRAQLEEARQLNATLRAEREVLQQQLVRLQAQIASENERLRNLSAKQEHDGSFPWLYMATTLLLVVAGTSYWARRR